MEINEIQERWPFLSIMHPAHLEYIKKMPYNTLPYFLRLVYELEPEKRHEIVRSACFLLFSSDSEREELRNLVEDRDGLFEAFGLKCIEVSKVFHEPLLVMTITQYMLYELSRMGNKTNVDKIKSNLVGLADHILSKDSGSVPPASEEFVDKLVNDATNMDEITERYYSLYIYFCENILVGLAEQERVWQQQIRETYGKDQGDDQQESSS